MPTILLTGDGYTANQWIVLEGLGYTVVHHSKIERDELMHLLPTIDVYVLGGDERLDRAALMHAQRLRLISFVGTGSGTFIDEVAASERGISITNTPEIMASAVAEHTVGLLLGTFRGLFAQNEATKRRGTWHPTKELSGAAIGIIGMGAIGSRVAFILTRAFLCQVRYASRTRKPDLESNLGITMADIDVLFEESDAVLLLVPLSADTENLVDSSRLARAKPGLILINTASARLVEPYALKDALESERVAAAAFDGYWIEPPPPSAEDPYGLLLLPDRSFVVTPHTAAKTGTWARMVDWAIKNVIEFPTTLTRR